MSVTPAVTSISGNLAPCPSTAFVTYTATAAAPTSAQSPISVFRWTLPAGVVRFSANSDSSEITVNFLSTYKGGAIAARGQSACGILGTAKSVTLQYLPPTPVSITGSTTAPCVGNTITYSVNVNPPTATQATAVGYRWTRPKNTTIISATSDSSSINLRFDAGYTGGSVTAKAVSACGVFGGVRSLTLTLCPARMSNSNLITLEGNNEVIDQIYPNPNNGNFKLTVNTGILENANATVRVVDIYGRLISQFNTVNNNGAIITDYKGSNLANGVYTVQYTVGSVSKSLKFVVQK